MITAQNIGSKQKTIFLKDVSITPPFRILTKKLSCRPPRSSSDSGVKAVETKTFGNMENTQITEYGKYTIGKEYQKSNFGAIFRLDTYTSNRDFEQHTEHTRCVNTTDRSFVYRGNRTPDKCYYCYVNAAHSEEYHIKNTQN